MPNKDVAGLRELHLAKTLLHFLLFAPLTLLDLIELDVVESGLGNLDEAAHSLGLANLDKPAWIWLS